MLFENLALVKAEMSSWLSDPQWDWTWVVTQTFKPQASQHRTRVPDSWMRWMQNLSSLSDVIYGFCFGELHRSGKTHWHAVVHVQDGLYGEVQRKEQFNWALEKYGRNRITAYQPNLREMGHLQTKKVSDGIARYCVKYVAKDYAIDSAWWDFLGFLHGNQVEPKQILRILKLPRVDLT